MKLASQTHRINRTFGLAALLATTGPVTAQAQTAYGVDATGALFSFSLSNPSEINPIGDLGFVPAGIDFRPSTSTLYAVRINSTTGDGGLYTVNTSNGEATLVEDGFTNAGMIGASSFSFDFNPTTLQPDTSVRIRFVADNNTNLRLHSDNGGIGVVDGSINGVPGAVVTGAAYTNADIAVIPLGGPTALYYIDSAGNNLLSSGNPNAGSVAVQGTLGVDVGMNVGFDIFSGGSANTAYLVDSTGSNIADLYTVDLGTGVATLVGDVARDFTGGFAIDQLSAIPEPSSFAALAGLLGLGFAAARRRRHA